MNTWDIFLIAIVVFLTVGTFIPLSRIQHWSVRGFDFIRIQMLVLLGLLLLSGLFFPLENSNLQGLAIGLLLISLAYQIAVIWPYIPFKKGKNFDADSAICLLSVNVKQENDDYNRLLEVVKKIKPDILLTMETNAAWEQAMSSLETEYNFNLKIPKENRYGMHFYTNLKVLKANSHALVSNEFPSVEVFLEDHHKNNFLFWGLHPPPPSPTEESTSKPKDAELMLAAKKLREEQIPTIVSGDFNNVCWSRSSKLFAKIAGLNDARIGRGFYSTFPVKPKIFRFPIDLIFNSKTLQIHQIKTLKPFGSDHLPLLTRFSIAAHLNEPGKQKISKEVKEQANQMIKDGLDAV